jgi:hypothetical protein
MKRNNMKLLEESTNWKLTHRLCIQMANQIFRRSSISSFVFAARNLRTQSDSLSSPFSDKHNLKTLIAGFKRGNPLPLLQNWVDQGNKLSPSELRCISRTLIKSNRYNHAFQVPFSLLLLLLYPCYATCVLQCSKVDIYGQLRVFTI